MVAKLREVPQIEGDKQVRVKESGNILEIMSRENGQNGKATTIKISKDEYIDTRSGEVKQFNHQTSRADDLKAVAHSLAFGRDILNTNIHNTDNCRWLTLTYAENMTNPKKLYNDFRNFNKRCRATFGHYEYITAAEPQGRGAWHLHCVLIFPTKAPYMANKTVADLWKQGFVNIRSLDNVDNVGAYITAYLGDMEFDVAKRQGVANGTVKTLEYEENGQKKTKRYIKGARLYMYPANFRIFRFSKGIKKPNVYYTDYETAIEKACGGAQTFSKAVMLIDENSDFADTIIYEYYNTKRIESQ